MTLASRGAPDPVEAARRLTDWGFLAESDLSDRPGPAYLLIALRDTPTLRHYDPEVVEYWATAGGRGVRRVLSRETGMPLDVDFSWGLIRILAVDIEPGFEARAAAVEPLTRYAAFIDDTAGRYRRSLAMRDRDPRFWALVRAEAARLDRDHAAAWRGRVELQRHV